MIKGADPAEAPKDVQLDDGAGDANGSDSGAGGSDAGGSGADGDADTRTVTATYNPTGGAF